MLIMRGVPGRTCGIPISYGIQANRHLTRSNYKQVLLGSDISVTTLIVIKALKGSIYMALIVISGSQASGRKISFKYSMCAHQNTQKFKIDTIRQEQGDTRCYR